MSKLAGDFVARSEAIHKDIKSITPPDENWARGHAGWLERAEKLTSALKAFESFAKTGDKKDLLAFDNELKAAGASLKVSKQSAEARASYEAWQGDND